jgi:hypothetical protein
MLAKIISLFTGGAGAAVGGTVANLAAGAALIAALTPAALWFVGNKDQVAVTLTWGQIGLFGAFLFVLIKVVHYTRSPGQ